MGRYVDFMRFTLLKRARLSPSIPVLLLISTALQIGLRLDGAEKPDFTGSYTLTATKGRLELDKASNWTLKAIQGDTEIKITKVMDGKTDNYEARLDGTEANYTSPGGAKGTCTLRLKGKTLMLETVVSSHIQAKGPLVQIRTRQHWTLSQDGTKLTIRSEVDSPTFPYGFQVVEPWTEIYTRR